MNEIPFSKIRQKNNLNWFHLFIILEAIILLSLSIINLVKHGKWVNSLMLDSQGQFGDYFMHIGYSSVPFGTNIYNLSTSIDTGVCFPPLAYLMYGLLARMVGYIAKNPTDIPSHMLVGNNLTIYLLYTIVSIVLLLYAISLYVKRKGFINQVLFPCILIFSYPFAFSSIQRGNSVLLVAVLMSIAIAWRDDDSAVKKESAMIIIAICAGLKIYPALLGFLYIKEKRIREALRLLLYGAIFFFAPFLFFGGIEGIKSFINNLLQLNGEIHRCSISGFTNAWMITLFGNSKPIIVTLVQQFFLVLSIIAFFLSKQKWGEILLLCGLMSVYVSSGWMYTCIYILPAMLYFFFEVGFQRIKITKGKWIEILIFILFLICFSIPYKLGYEFIYDMIIVCIFVYITYTFVIFILHRAKMDKSTVVRNYNQ